MRIKLVFLIILTSSFFYSCDNQPPIPPGSFEDVSLANNDMGFRLMKTLQQEESDKNVFISPFSISSALTMTANGAEGVTQEEMYTALGLSKLDEPAINKQYKTILDALLQSSQGMDFNIANGIFYRKGFEAKQEFLEQAQDNFEGKIEQLDFDDPGAKDRINDWVEGQTENRIKEMVSDITQNDMMFLINAIYLKGPWVNGFAEQSTTSRDFTFVDGNKDSVDLMFLDSFFPYVEEADYQAIALHLGKDEARFSVDIILPNQLGGLEDIVDNFSVEEYTDLINSMNAEENVQTRVMITLPKFEINYEKQLKKTLQALGIEKAFQDGGADLSGIAEAKNLHISRVKHKTFLKIDEKGVEAAGSTSVGVSVTSLPPQMTVNRPFLLILRDIQTGTILFMGKVMNPLAG